MVTLTFENGSLVLTSDEEFQGILMRQPWDPTDGAKTPWPDAATALAFWNDNLREQYSWIADEDLTVDIEV